MVSAPLASAPTGGPSSPPAGGASGFDTDVIVVGSGFGGATAALRLAEKGHRVVVLEKGRRHSRDDLLAARRDPRHFLYQPEVGLRKGFFWQRVFRDVAIIGASGVGGGSIVWAAVLLEPKDSFFTDPAWAHLDPDWKATLAPHYAEAARMLGRTTCPVSGPMDDHLAAASEAQGGGDTFGPVPVAIYFGERGRTVADPFFDGDGPDRTGCHLCGGCLVGCPHGSKNTLDLNYLYLAERRGAEIRPEHRVDALKPLPGGGYEVGIAGRPPLRARNVVLAGGVLGTLELLYRCRDELGTLPDVSSTLGEVVRTNSEAVTAILDADADADLSVGPTISSHYYPDAHTHITQNRYMGGWHMRFQLGPLVDGVRPGRRALDTLVAIARRPAAHAKVVAARNFERRLTALTVMQDHDNQVGFRFARSPMRPWRRVLRSGEVRGGKAPSYLPVANDAARAFAASSGGTPLNLLVESVGGVSMTAHILGGASMGADPTEGVIDIDHQVFGHPGLYVVDAAAIPANLGVNPSLTICALAERFAARFPAPVAEATDPSAVRAPGAGASDEATVGNATRMPTSSAPLAAWLRCFRTLPAPALPTLEGTFAAELLGPRAMRKVATVALARTGLPGWEGKRFFAVDGAVAGTNRCRPAGGDEVGEVLPMRVTTDRSRWDGFTVAAITYRRDAPRPWRWVRDEVRAVDQDTLVGITMVDVPGGRRCPTPFLLRRVPG
ncbi:MAG: GMC family oxidoreductase [Acidimicrobiia bacterium]|nr:GMC family oxidoreductase [Acidimicrobiia bacterium]